MRWSVVKLQRATSASEILSRIPPEFRLVLKTVQQSCPSAVIAGGALRDLAFGGPVKDIDIFVPADEGPLAVPPTWERAGLIPCGYVTGLRDEVTDVQGWNVQGCEWPVQIITLNVQHDGNFICAVCQRMDFAACRIAFDGDRVHSAVEFSIDIEAGRMTLVRCEDSTQARRSLRRAERFRKKYPNVSIDVTLAYEKLGANIRAITRRSPIDGVERTMHLPVTDEQLQAWRSGTPIQRVMPHLSDDEREFIMTGITPEQWEKFFGNDD